MQGIRNPRAHEVTIVNDLDICLDHLSFVSLLLRRLEQAGYKWRRGVEATGAHFIQRGICRLLLE